MFTSVPLVLAVASLLSGEAVDAPTLTVRVGRASDPVVGADVNVSAQEGKWKSEGRTDEQGRVVFHPPTAGAYRIVVSCRRPPICGGIDRLEKISYLVRGV
jgi:hypothetical protein